MEAGRHGIGGGDDATAIEQDRLARAAPQSLERQLGELRPLRTDGNGVGTLEDILRAARDLQARRRSDGAIRANGRVMRGNDDTVLDESPGDVQRGGAAQVVRIRLEAESEEADTTVVARDLREDLADEPILLFDVHLADRPGDVHRKAAPT